MFKLHPQLEKDTIIVRNLKLCQLLLMNNCFYPWLILVPRRPDLVEITDLSNDNQIDLLAEINLVSRLMQKIFNPDKLNIAALGNIVSQLHIHVIARFKNDRTFPKPVWVDNHIETYDQEQVKKIMERISSFFN